VVSAEEAKAAREAKATATDNILTQVKTLFNRARPIEQMEIVEWVCEEVGAELAPGFETDDVVLLSDEEIGQGGDEDLLGIPEILDRRGESGAEPAV